MSCIESDLATIFGTGDFGVEALFDGRYAVMGHFDTGDTVIDGGEGAAVIVHQIKFTCATSAVGDAPEGKTLKVNGTTYTIRETMTDGVGVTELHLEGPSLA
jgi:hypothetical protein